MPIQDKVAAARKISELLNGIIKYGDFRLKYRILVDPPAVDSHDSENPVILVDLSGADSPLLLERGADVNHCDKDATTPLLVAAYEGHHAVCELLLEADADVDHADGNGRTARLLMNLILIRAGYPPVAVRPFALPAVDPVPPYAGPVTPTVPHAAATSATPAAGAASSASQ